MTPEYPGRNPIRSRMQLHDNSEPLVDRTVSEFAHQEMTFIIGNKALFLAVKRAIDISGGFHVIGAFRLDDLATCLRRSTNLGQIPRVSVIHEATGERARADEAAHLVLDNYPGTGIVLISGSELDVESERKLGVHDYKAIVLPETVIRHPKALANGMHAGIAQAGNTEPVA